MDLFSKEKRSEIMSKIHGKDTKPELIVRKRLFSEGFRFRIHQKNLPGKPDIVLRRYNTIILVNGCFWHGHKNCKISRIPKTRQNYWIPKITNNVIKDSQNQKALEGLGWNVVIVWECQLRSPHHEKTLEEIVNNLLGKLHQPIV